MPAEANAVIRKFKDSDREAVRQITFDTAFLGRPASVFFSGREVLCDSLTLYFTDYEPQSCFVAEINGEVIGCLLGARDKAAAEKIAGRKINPKILWRALREGVFFRRKNLVFIFKSFFSILRC